MKKIFYNIVFLVLMVCIMVSCASASTNNSGTYKPSAPGEIVIGSLQTTFETIAANSGNRLNEMAYNALLAVAQKEYQGNIDVRNITLVVGRPTGESRAFSLTATYEIIASGVVVQVGGITATNMEEALERAAKDLSESFPTGARIAIVYITSQDKSTTDFFIGELEHVLHRHGYFIIDRSELDRVRAEQQFGMSGEVDDNSAASIGHLAGASIVITGRIDGEGDLRRLRLRALNVTTGQVVGTASERL